MKIHRLLSIVLLCGIVAGCSSLPTAKNKLAKTWSAQDVSVKDRAAAVKRCFKPGTEMSKVVKVLGTNYVKFAPSPAVIAAQGPDFPKTAGLMYYFGRDFVLIQTDAPVDGDPLKGKFVKAGYSAP